MWRRIGVSFVGIFLLLAGLYPWRSGEARPSLGVESSTAHELIEAVNALRAAHGLSPYRVDPILMSIAQAQAEYMASIGTWTHTGPDGSRPYQRALAAGYLVAGDLSRGGWFSENVIMGRNLSAAEAVQSWLGDDAHRNTMLGAIYRDVGAGAAISGSTYYYCLDVGLSTGGTPVIYTPFGNTPTATIVPNTPKPDGSIVHIVQPGENLSRIAQAYGVSLADVLLLNRLTLNSVIYPGQEIVIRLAFTPTPTQPTPTSTRLPTLTPWPTTTPFLPSPTMTLPVSVESVPAPLGRSQALAAVALIGLAAFALAALVAFSASRKR